MARDSQAIKTKQLGGIQQRDSLSSRGLASPNGSSGLTWKKAAEILGTMLVHLPIADWPRVCALGLGGSTLVETHGRKASPITPFPRTQCTGHHWVRVGPPPHCDTTAASLACVLPCCPSQINRSACGLRSDSSSTQRTNRFTPLNSSNLRVDHPVAIFKSSTSKPLIPKPPNHHQHIINMRFTIASVAIMAGAVAAVPQYSVQPISQISDGQIQAPPATSAVGSAVPLPSPSDVSVPAGVTSALSSAADMTSTRKLPCQPGTPVRS